MIVCGKEIQRVTFLNDSAPGVTDLAREYFSVWGWGAIVSMGGSDEPANSSLVLVHPGLRRHPLEPDSPHFKPLGKKN